MRKFLSLALILGFVSFAQAHGMGKGPHGSMLVHAGRYHIEVVAKEKVIDVFVSEFSGEPVKASGFKGLAILAVDGEALRIPLLPTADGVTLQGSAPVSLDKPFKGAVQITMPDGTTATAKLN